jgi:asparagine synthase (glutamine-hydrolysing)
MHIKVESENSFCEKKFGIHDKVFIKGHIYSHSMNQIIEMLRFLNIKNINFFINSLNGNFALIVQKKEFSFIAVDRICSAPLFFTKTNGKFCISHDPKKIVNQASFKKSVVDSAILEISMSGYTIGAKTIYKDLHILKAGEFVVFSNDDFKRAQYYKYFGDTEYKNYTDYIEELSEVTLNIFRRLLNDVGDRQIIIPLSAGNDSRLIASVLKHLGASNVKCYSYGSAGNFEVSISKIVAEKLGYEWIFVPLTHKSESFFYDSTEYKDYLKFAETYCSVPYIQSLSTIKYLKEMKWIDDDAIFINGNSGDFISGAHINALSKNLNNTNSETQRMENILDNLVKKHFSLWGYLKKDKNIKKIKNILWSEITSENGMLQNKKNDHLFYEYSELIDRQSKYVIAGQKIYEFYNYEWILPLWDDEYLFFWQKVPVEFKINQQLYTDMLKKKNYGDVWGSDIPVNKKNITPKWIIPVRFLFKIPFILFGVNGKKAWKQLEINLFYYWMDDTHMVDTTDYFSIIKSIFRKPRNHVSWQAENYLKIFIKE